MRKASLLDFVEVAEEEEADTGRTATVGISPRLRGLQKKQKSQNQETHKNHKEGEREAFWYFIFLINLLSYFLS